MASLDIAPLLRILSKIDQAYSHLVELDDTSGTLTAITEQELNQTSILEAASSHLVELSYAIRVQIAEFYENARIRPKH